MTTDAVTADILLELEYTCEDDNEHQMIRFRGDAVEEHDRIETYPPFIHLTLPDEANPLPVLEFGIPLRFHRRQSGFDYPRPARKRTDRGYDWHAGGQHLFLY